MQILYWSTLQLCRVARRPEILMHPTLSGGSESVASRASSTVVLSTPPRCPRDSCRLLGYCRGFGSDPIVAGQKGSIEASMATLSTSLRALRAVKLTNPHTLRIRKASQMLGRVEREFLPATFLPTTIPKELLDGFPACQSVVESWLSWSEGLRLRRHPECDCDWS